MEDSTDTIIISEIGENVEGKDFVEFIKKPGPVKVRVKYSQTCLKAPLLYPW